METLHQRWLERSSSDTERIKVQPLVSIICFCKDRASTIRRCIASVLNQSYRNIEFVVQDGASTDGTLEILRSYDDSRIKLVSEKDSGPAEGFWRVMNRCEGDIIGTCLSDEELLPDAVERAIGHFRAAPHLGAISCDGYVTDPTGKIINEFNAGEFNFVDYLFGWYCPFWPGSFFRRQALLEVGLKTHLWTIECLEFETWCRLATMHEVKYIPERMSKYAIHEKQLSQTKAAFHEHFDNRAVLIRRMFSKDGFFGENDAFLGGCLYNQLYLLYNHVRAYKLQEQMELLAQRMRDLVSGMDLRSRIQSMEYFNFVGAGLHNKKAAAGGISFVQRVSQLWNIVALRLPASWRQRIPRRVKRFLRLLLTGAILIAVNLKDSPKHVLGTLVGLFRNYRKSKDLFAPEFSPRVYHEIAKLYYARGQIEEALQYWRRAAVLEDAVVDGLACQAMLMAPSASYEGLLAAQTAWAGRYASPVPGLGKHTWKAYDGKRRVRVGYFCSFLDSDTIRFIMLQVIKQRDATRFETYGYSPSPSSSDIVEGFDHFRVTGSISDEKFVQQIRSDGIDVFVELSGFSPHHRFAAMASRCAPVQISYLNHTGTSGVLNVDYVLADAISVPSEEDCHFTETVWRLPGCFLCYNYDSADLPEVAPSPYQHNGYVTFGCFGSGGKINLQIIELWAEIMRRVPNSKFFIRNGQLDSSDNRQYLLDRFARYGIAQNRLRILGGTDRNTILKNYAELDVSLDTWPYCGGNSIAEPIWQGVPVITLKGERFSSRYGASLVIAAGTPELVGTTADEYVDISVRLALAPERLDHYRRNLRGMARKNGLSDANAFARKLEAAYIEMLRRVAA